MRRANDNLDRARLTMKKRVLAGMIDIEFVVGMLDRRELQPTTGQLTDQINDQRGLARILESGNTKNMHIEIDREKLVSDTKSMNGP